MDVLLAVPYALVGLVLIFGKESTEAWLHVTDRYWLTTHRIGIECTRAWKHKAEIANHAVGATCVRVQPSGEGTITFLQWDYRSGQVSRKRGYYPRVQPVRWHSIPDARAVHRSIQQRRSVEAPQETNASSERR
jgi:hypothetical protein